MYHEYQNYIRSEFDVTNFKRRKEYNNHMEHVPYEVGVKFADAISKHPFVLQGKITPAQVATICKKNDSIGLPLTNVFSIGSKLFTASPSSLRYFYHGLLVAEHITSFGIPQPVEIAEIGSGYGGLFVILDEIFSVLGISIRKYHLIELPEGNIVQRNFLKAYNKTTPTEYEIWNHYGYGKEILPSDEGNGLYVISNFGLSEIEAFHREKYIQNFIIPKAKHGFFVWNMSTFVPFGTDFNFTIDKEEPMTCDLGNNKYIKF